MAAFATLSRITTSNINNIVKVFGWSNEIGLSWFLCPVFSAISPTPKNEKNRSIDN